MKCPKCNTEVTLKQFHVKGKGDHFLVRFECVKCGCKKRDSFPADVFGDIDKVAAGMVAAAELKPEDIDGNTLIY